MEIAKCAQALFSENFGKADMKEGVILAGKPIDRKIYETEYKNE